MGVLNVTPDSFSDGGRFLKPDAAYRQAIRMEKEGADIIDIGGESTRPGSASVSVEEELRRLVPVLARLKGRLKIPISIDTKKAEVAEAALKLGASIVNDVSGLHGDERIASLCARYKAGLVIMHMKGSPKTMQRRPVYKDLLADVASYINKGTRIALKAGVKKESIIIDPGIGFGKTLNHNLRIIKELGFFKRSGFAVLIGLSRKSFIGKLFGLEVGERLIPTVCAEVIAINNGADIIRAHDVKEAVMAAKMVDAIKREKLRKEKISC